MVGRLPADIRARVFEDSRWFLEREVVFPALELPEEWTPSSPELPFEAVRLAARAGVAIDLDASEPVDLRWFDDAIPYITRLSCFGPPENYSGLEVLAEMRSLVYLRASFPDARVDLSSLPRLSQASVGPGLLSAVRAPAMVDAAVVTDALPEDFRVPARIKQFSIGDASEFDAQHLRDAGALRRLWISGVGSVDFSALDGGDRLELISITEAKSLDGLATIVKLKSLDELRLIRVQSIDNPLALSAAPIDGVEVERCPDIDEATAAMITPGGPHWHIMPSRARSKRPARNSTGA